MAAKTLDDINAAGKRVLVRVDLNVPVKQGKVSDATRIERILPTIRELVRKNAKVILLAHFGRPKGRPASEMSLRPIAAEIGRLIDRPVEFAANCIGEPARTAVSGMKNGDVVLLENTRFHEGEETNDAQFAARLAENGDLYVNDAFSAAHRAHASTEGIARLLPAYAGRSLQAELEALQAGLENPAHPVAAVVGGAKVSTKIDLLENLLTRVDSLIIGGGMANTFLFAQGYEIGNSLCERDLAETAGRIMSVAESAGCRIVLPSDVVVAEAFRANAPHDTVPISAIPEDRMVLDLGPDSLAEIESVFAASATLVWNGPLGAFELPPFDTGTVTAARAAARLTGEGKLFSVAGGGDTVAALNHAGVANAFNYVSTAGGAFLEWLEGKRLPGIAVLQR